MRRRSHLGAIGAVAVAGCLSSSGAEGDGSPREDVTLANEVDPDPPEAGFPRLAVDGDGVPEDHESSLRVIVGVVQQYSSDRPARLQIDLVNESSESRDLSFGPSPPFSSHLGQQADGDARVYVAPDEEGDVGIVPVDDESRSGSDRSAFVDGCWAIDGVGQNDIAKNATIQPGHVLSGKYSVYADAGNDGCLPAGSYRFDQAWTGSGSSTSFRLDWGFSLTVERSGSSNRAAFLVR